MAMTWGLYKPYIKTHQEVCEKSPHVQVVKEEFEHYWRKKYYSKTTKDNVIYNDRKGFFSWNSVKEYE